MRTLSILALTAVLATPLAAQGNDPDKKVTGGGTLPAGWSAHLDTPTASLNDVKFVVMGPTGLHATTGPAVVLWREADAVKAPFHTLATFTQTKAPPHPEAYGLIIAGKALNTATPSYTYFIVRGDGKFMINKMENGVRTIIVPWTDNAAIVKQDSAGKATNKLEIDGKVDPTKVSFKVNGKSVHEIPAANLNLDGIVGLRVNHNLDTHIDGFAVHKM